MAERGERDRRAVARLALGLIAIALATTGCQYLFAGTPFGGFGNVAGASGEPTLSGPFPIDSLASFPPGQDPDPSPLATFTRARATISLSDGTTIILDRLSRGPHLYSVFGSSLRWSNADGWYLALGGAGADTEYGAAYVQLDRVTGGQHWTSDELGRCQVTIASADKTGIRGSASCEGIRWMDALTSGFSAEPPYVAGQDPFSAQITFSATP